MTLLSGARLTAREVVSALVVLLPVVCGGGLAYGDIAARLSIIEQSVASAAADRYTAGEAMRHQVEIDRRFQDLKRRIERLEGRSL